MSRWLCQPLFRLGKVITGSTPRTAEPRFYGGEVPFITPAELDKIGLITYAPRTLSESGANEAKVLPEGTVMVCCIGSLGKVGMAGRPVATNQQINAVVFNTKLIWPRFGYYACRLLKPKLESMAPATTVAIVSKSKFEILEIPVPPLAEQRRIAEILDQAEALRAKRRHALGRLDTLTQSIFIDIFGDPVTNPKRWDEATSLGDLAEIVSGITKGRKVNGVQTREVPYLAVINVQDRELNLGLVKTIDATEDEIKRYKLQRDDLLLTEGGDPDKLGRGTLWNEELQECIHQNHIFRVRLMSTSLHPLFLNWLVGSQRGKKYFLRSAKQTTGIVSINMTQLRGFPLLIPPLPLQREFAAQLAAVERQKMVQRASLAKLDELFASLQHRAFRGEL
jgi:type I restriction enzyme, S subunit